MSLKETPLCEFGKPAPGFSLKGTDGRIHTLEDCRGERGTLVMFICNHCPYVKAARPRLLRDAGELVRKGVGVVAVNSNDPTDYPDDSFDNMVKIAGEYEYPFPYLVDETQEVARAYGAVCTPDFFGYNADLELQYRGRLDEGRIDPPRQGARRELLDAMLRVAETGRGPKKQQPSMGCSIKWRG